MMTDVVAQPNEEAADRHDTVNAKGQETGAEVMPTILHATAHQGGGGADPKHPHLFHLASTADSAHPGGSLHGAIAADWSILAGQQGSVCLAGLKPGGVRQLRWYPSAWERISSSPARNDGAWLARAVIYDGFDGSAGGLVFGPQCHFHFFENASETEEPVVLTTFNASSSGPEANIGVVASVSALPADVRGAVFGTMPEEFETLRRNTERVVIARKPGYRKETP